MPVIPGTYSGTLTRVSGSSRERESRERQTDKTDRRVADDDVTSESHKSIAQTNRTQNADVTSKNGMTKRRLGHSRATQVLMEDLRLVNLTEICPSRRVGHFKAPC